MRKFFSALTIVVYLAVTLVPAEGYAAPQVVLAHPLSAQSAVLLESRTNRVLFAKRANLERPAASTTKVMTALVIFDHLPLNRVVQVPRSAEAIPPSKIYLRSGERFYVRDLLKALLISSANDTAHTLAVACAGSEGKFASLMNAKARRIGARHTRFTNASGLPNPRGQYTTAYDLALIMKEAQKNWFIRQVLAQKTSQIRALTGRRIFLRNHNRFLWRAPGRVLGKTGFTRRALHCFVGKINAPQRGDVLVAIMGSLTPWRDLTILLGATNRLSALQMQFNRVNLRPAQVATLQRALWRAGFRPGRVDGIFGSQTLRAVKSFQRSKGLTPDGIVGSRTWAKLRPYFS
ncbi:MAG: peptidoglycan-binding protein [Candidatus Omnitrophica bacterium]|nr:peptidoglycan-binding protein [Candidatus Omnitrophota bacterium]